MRPGVVGLSLSRFAFDETLRFVREIGGECIELCTVPGAHRGTLDLSPSNRLRVKEMVGEAGLQISAVAGYNDFSFSDYARLRDEVKRLRGYMELAANLGCPLVRAFGGDFRPNVEREDVIDSIVRGFRESVKWADEYNVRLALENHGRLVNHAPSMARIVEEVGSERLRVTLDTGNFRWAGYSLKEVRRFLSMLVPYTVNVHLKDGVLGKDGTMQFLPLGEGELDIAGIIAALRRAGYSGPLCSEFEGAGDPKGVLGSDGTVVRDPAAEALIREGTRKSLAYLHTLLSGA